MQQLEFINSWNITQAQYYIVASIDLIMLEKIEKVLKSMSLLGLCWDCEYGSPRKNFHNKVYYWFM